MRDIVNERIDAHHHLWEYRREEYPWMAESMGILRRDFLVEDLRQVLDEAGIDGVVTVQARQMVEETEWLLDLASRHDFMRGVVGWVPLVEPSVGALLERFAAWPKLKAVRHVLHDEPDDFYMLRPDFNRGIGLLEDLGLRYDILIFERHLPQTIEFVDRHPNQVFIVDHIAKPRIKEHVMSPWCERMAELARRENVYCKISGMVTEAAWKSWTQSDLRPYFGAVLSAFGPNRLMFGSDWPVLTLASDYKTWVNTFQSFITMLSADEQARVGGGTVIEAYNL